jgi:hypothetical protein
MPLLIIELTFSNVVTALAAFGIAGTVVGYFIYSARTQKPKVRADAVSEFSQLAEALKTKLELMQGEIGALRGEHERCQRKINEVTAFNLRLQAREYHYQNRINRLERALGLEITDFNDFTASPEDSIT